MKIKLNQSNDEQYGTLIHQLFINDKEVEFIQALHDCPEDASIERDLISGRKIIEYMLMAYEAGKNGENLDLQFGNEIE